MTNVVAFPSRAYTWTAEERRLLVRLVEGFRRKGHTDAHIEYFRGEGGEACAALIYGNVVRGFHKAGLHVAYLSDVGTPIMIRSTVAEIIRDQWCDGDQVGYERWRTGT